MLAAEHQALNSGDHGVGRIREDGGFDPQRSCPRGPLWAFVRKNTKLNTKCPWGEGVKILSGLGAATAPGFTHIFFSVAILLIIQTEIKLIKGLGITGATGRLGRTIRAFIFIGVEKPLQKIAAKFRAGGGG